MELVYADLETDGPFGCRDNTTFFFSRKYCSKWENYPVVESYPAGRYWRFSFWSDGETEYRGALWAIYSGAPGEKVKVVCDSYRTFPTTTYPPPIGHTLSLNGSAEVRNFEQCYENDYIHRVDLHCQDSEVIHISNLDFARSSNRNCSRSPSCTWNTHNTINNCEGKSGSCSIEVYWETRRSCSAIDKMSLSFQCVSKKLVHTMCPYQPTSTPLNGHPAFFETPGFVNQSTNPFSPYLQCRCSFDNPNYNITIKLLYASLQTIYFNEVCFNHVNFFSNGDLEQKHCNRTILNTPVQKSSPTTFEYFLETENKHRGAWFGVYPDSSSRNGIVTCEQYSGNFARTTRFLQTTASLPSNDEKTMYGVAGGIFAIIAAMIAMIIYVSRKHKSNRTVNQQQNQELQVTFTHESGQEDFTGQGSLASSNNATPSCYSVVEARSSYSVTKSDTSQEEFSPPSYTNAVMLTKM